MILLRESYLSRLKMDNEDQSHQGNFDVQFDELAQSQSSDLSEGQLDALVTESKPATTQRCTDWGLRKFSKWSEKRNIKTDFATVSPDELNNTLRKFYAELKSDKGMALTPSALTGIRAALFRALISPPYSRNFNIIVDKEFMSANQMFSAKCKLYCKTHNPKPKHKKSIGSSDMMKLKEYFSDAFSDPTKLQEFVWFSLCFHFGRRGREGWREMRKADFLICRDSDDKRYVTMISTEVTKNHQGGHKQKDQDYSEVRMYENKDTPLDPVAAVELYISKLHPESPVLFQKPRKVFDKENIWYTREVLGKNTLGTIMQTISRKAGLSETYTCHCVRASTVTTLYQAGVDAHRICAITKHTNQSSLAHYIDGNTESQMREASSILNQALTTPCENAQIEEPTEPCSTSSDQYREMVVSIPHVDSPGDMQVVDIPPMPPVAPMALSVDNTNQVSRSAQLLQSIMPGSSFSNCSFAFQGMGGESHM